MMLLIMIKMTMMMIELIHFQIHQLVEPVDSLHPTQAAQALITEQVRLYSEKRNLPLSYGLYLKTLSRGTADPI